MSYIRAGSDGHYIDIPEGSNYYIYGDGERISGWSEGEFAALIAGVLDEAEWDEKRDTASTQSAGYIKQAFEDHFGGWDEEYSNSITPPERAEIFCQCVDSRIDGIELTDALHYTVREWANSFDAYRECTHCGEEFRPHLYDDSTEYVCNERECRMKFEAECYGLTVEEAKTAREFEDFDDEWAYIVEHSDEDLWE